MAIRTTRKQLRRLIESLLMEATCPEWGSKDAYIGMNDVECSNKSCSNFSQKQLQSLAPVKVPSVKSTSRTTDEILKEFEKVELDISTQLGKLNKLWDEYIAQGIGAGNEIYEGIEQIQDGLYELSKALDYASNYDGPPESN